jgi:hypothetical protein
LDLFSLTSDGDMRSFSANNSTGTSFNRQS